MTTSMTTFISRRNWALLNAILIVCAVLGFSIEGYAQCPPPPPLGCDTCLQVAIDTNHNLCQGPPPDTNTCVGCYTWALINHCSACIDTIRITSDGAKFTSCCVVVEDPSHGNWSITQEDDFTVQYSVPPGGACLHEQSLGCPPPILPVPGILQITTCGLSPGDPIQIAWSPADGSPPACPPSGGQWYSTKVP